MDEELNELNTKMNAELKAIKVKYNDLKKGVKNKYKPANTTPKNKRKAIPKALKDQVWDLSFGAKAGVGKCYCCSTEINSKKFECGHIQSVAEGGITGMDNLKPVCSPCNKSMGTKNMDEYKATYYQKSTKTTKTTVNYFNSYAPSRFDASNQNHLNKLFGVSNSNTNTDINNRFQPLGSNATLFGNPHQTENLF